MKSGVLALCVVINTCSGLTEKEVSQYHGDRTEVCEFINLSLGVCLFSTVKSLNSPLNSFYKEWQNLYCLPFQTGSIFQSWWFLICIFQFACFFNKILCEKTINLEEKSWFCFIFMAAKTLVKPSGQAKDLISLLLRVRS